MSNRQARREQQRTTRQTRPTRPAPGRQPGRGGTPPKRTSGPNLFSPLYLAIVGAIIVVMVAVIAIVKITGGSSSSGSSTLVTDLQQELSTLPTNLINGTSIGDANAPLKLVEYEDFQCPYCLKYTAEQEPQLIDQFVKAGKLQITYKNLPILGKGESVRAAVAAECAGAQGKFWQFHNKLFTIEAQAGQASGNEQIDVGRFSDANLQKYASGLGLDMTKFNSCMASPDTLTQVTSQEQEAKQYGFQGTPSFLINGQPLGAGTPSSIADWQSIFNQVLATPTATTSPSPSATTSPSPSATTPLAGTSTAAAGGTVAR